MIILCLLAIPFLCLLIKLILYLIVKRYGKFSYDGFSAAGFVYNSSEDIFYSTLDAWQKNFGYTHMYDVLAPVFRMIIDTESVKFYYNNKNWLITFWKGQYGIVTGAEIGVYCTKQKKVNKKTVYFPVNDLEMPYMYLILYKGKKEIARRSARHWWLAVFKLGMFSKPKNLSMNINITFHNPKMLEAFLEAFKKKGYKSKQYKVIDNTFCFKFKKPRTRKVGTRTFLTDAITQSLNKKNVRLYNNYLDDLIENDGIDNSQIPSNKDLIMVNDLLPDLLKNTSNSKKYTKEIARKIFDKKTRNLTSSARDIEFKNRVDKL